MLRSILQYVGCAASIDASTLTRDQILQKCRRFDDYISMKCRSGSIVVIFVLARLAGTISFSRVVEKSRNILFSQLARVIALRELLVGVGHLAGVVTYIDANDKQLWLQDETGALSGCNGGPASDAFRSRP